MATVDSPAVLKALLDNNGVYPGDDPNNPVVRIVQYTNHWGNRTHGIVYASDKDWFRYENETEFVQPPFKVIFVREV